MYEIKLSLRATKQSKKLDTHLKELIKRKIKKALTSDPYRYPLLSARKKTFINAHTAIFSR